MALTAYSKYRILITRSGASAANAPGYCIFNEIRMYASTDGTGTSLLTGGTATASDTLASNVAANAFDNNAATFWESSNTAAASRWIRYDLPSAVTVRSVYLSATAYPNEVPRDFIIQGSNDGTTWENISTLVDWSIAMAKSETFRVDLVVRGTSVLETGVGSSRVLLHRWADYAFVATVIPDSSTGAWEVRLRDPSYLLVTHIGPAGYRPESDGPITPFAE